MNVIKNGIKVVSGSVESYLLQFKQHQINQDIVVNILEKCCDTKSSNG